MFPRVALAVQPFGNPIDAFQMKKEIPTDTLSLILLSWITPLCVRAKNGHLDVKDLPILSESDRSVVISRQFDSYWDAIERGEQASIWKLTVSTSWKLLYLQIDCRFKSILFSMVNAAIALITPQLVRMVSQILTKDD